jgi:hypothetical protein
MASLLGGGFMGEGGMPPSTVDFVSMRKTWAVSGLLSRGRVGSTDDGIRSTTWVLFSKGRIGSTDGNQIDHLDFTLQRRSGIDRWM